MTSLQNGLWSPFSTMDGCEDETKPKSTPLVQAVSLAQQIYITSKMSRNTRDYDKSPSAILADLRNKPLGKNSLSSPKGISADWLLDVFFRLPFFEALVKYGCELWFVRKVCINELLRRYDIHNGPLVDHVDVIQQAAASHYHYTTKSNSWMDNQTKPIVQEKATVFVSFTGRFLLAHLVRCLLCRSICLDRQTRLGIREFVSASIDSRPTQSYPIDWSLGAPIGALG
jgi:hypothetical protein